MKKSIRNTIISLALCASASCVVGGISFMQSEYAVAAAATTTAYYTLDGFTIDESASVRNTSPNGIRFQTVLDEDTQKAISDLDLDNVSYGTLLLPADYLGSQELTHESSQVLDIATEKWQDEEKTTWTSVLAGSNGSDLSESYYNRPIAARSYVTGTDNNGNTVYYYTENTAVRSIGYVAMMEYLDPNGNVTELIGKIVDKTKTNVELVFNAASQISVVQNNEEGTALISNSLEKSSDAVAVLKIGGIAAPSNMVDITYTVEDGSVIDVNDETLTALKEGETVVKATCNFNGVDYSVVKSVSTAEYVGTSNYKILITEAAKNSLDISVDDFSTGGQSSKATYERTAAEKLQSVLLEATGVKLPIVTSVNSGDKYISIGETQAATANTTLDGTVQAKDTASEVFVVDGNVYIRGSVANESILYGVQQFLGDTVGYDFFMENTYTVDKNVEVVVNAKTYVPDIEFNVNQGDLRSDGIMDDYAMQSYMRDIIALGLKEGDGYYKGVAHNSTLVVNAGTNATNDGTLSGSTSSFYKGAYLYNDASSQTWQKWYATYKAGSIITADAYRTISDPYNKKTIMAELCYTAHGDSTAYDALIKVVADEMIAQLAANPTLTRLGFSQADHRYWCECSYCKADGNPSDNLLEFLLDVAKAVEDRWDETGRSDDDKALFKISSLFYHQTNAAPTNTSAYTDKLSTYGKHVEIWFAESGADYVVPFDDTSFGSKWNSGVYDNLKKYKDLADEYGMDMLWWGYYGTTVQFYIPYDSIDAIRGNYAIAKDLGIDYMYNQMMGSKQNFARLKEYLMSKLEWETPADDMEWNNWIEAYFDSAYGAGSEYMQDYYDLWKMNDTYKKAQLTPDTYDATAKTVHGSIGRTNVLTSTYFTVEELQKWIDTIDQAIAALDPNDPNYDTYYWNIKLEKATPLYLMMYIFGDNTIETDELPNDYTFVTDYTDTDFDDKSYARKYGAEFLEIIDHWKLDTFGESQSRSIDDFRTAINSALSGVTSTTVEDKQTVVAGSSFTLSNEALTAGTYDITVTNVSNLEDKTTFSGVSVNAGTATINTTLTVGQTYIVELSSTTANFKFTNVLAISGYITTVEQLKSLSGNGYWVLANDINCANATFASKSTFTGVLDGDNKTVSNLTVGEGGLFGTLSGATVKNVTFANVTVSGDTMSAESVFGEMSDATFENVNVYGENAAASWPNGVNVNYTKVDKNHYVVSGEKDVWLYSDKFVKGETYSVTVDGVSTNYTVFVNGKLNVTVGAIAVGAQKTVVCRNNATNNSYGFDVIGITKFITNAAELKALGMGGNVTATKHLKGYYVLANNITFTHEEDYSDVIAAGFHRALDASGNHSYEFQGVFDGNGYTIENMRVSDGGIFGYMRNATVRNLILTNVHLLDSVPSSISSQSGGYAAILAFTAPGSTFEDIEISIASSPSAFSWKRDGLFVCTSGEGAATYRNITVDAVGLQLKTLLGISHDSNNVYENVLIKAAGYVAIGYTADSYSDGAQNKAALMTEWPSGVTFEKILKAETKVVFNDGSDLPVYDGDVTALGFAEGTNVVYSKITDGWDSRAKVLTSSSFDYVDVQFSLSQSVILCVWDGVAGNYNVSATGGQAASNAAERTIQVLDANGNTITSFAANTVYTLRVYLLDKSGTVAVSNLQISTFTAGATIYYGNVVHGKTDGSVIKLDVSNVEIYDGESETIEVTAFSGDETLDNLEYKWENVNGENDIVIMEADGASATFKAVAPGKATYKVSTTANGYYVEKTFIVTVMKNQVTLDETAIVGIQDATFTVPASITDTVEEVVVDGVKIYDRAAGVGSLSGTEGTFDSSLLSAAGEGKTMVIATAKTEYTLSAIVATNIITTAEELKALGMGGNVTATDNLKGYYLLGNDITFTSAEDYSDVIAAGYHKALDASGKHSYSFQGVFNGNGYTIDNMRVSDGGIFGYMNGATVKNLILTNVHLLDNVPSSISSQSGGYAAILAFTAPGSTFEDIEISIASSPSAFSWKRDGLLVCTSIDGGATYRNITVDASGLKLKTLLGINHKDSNAYENVVIKAVGYVAIGYTADSYVSGVQNTAALMSDFPKGVTYEYASRAIFNDNTALPVYKGDETALGFAEDTVVSVVKISDGWGSRAIVATDNSYDYVDVQFSLSQSVAICIWDGITGNYNVVATGEVSVSGAAERTIQLLNPEPLSFAANKVYTLRIYLKDVNGANEVTKLQISTFTAGTTIYFGNVTFGNDDDAGIEEIPEIDLDETTLISLKDSTMTVPEDVTDAVTSILIGDTVVYDAAEGIGSIDGDVVTLDSSELANITVATNQTMVIYTASAKYELPAIVYTDVITTAAELKALGVGGMVNTDITANITGYYVLANDITIEQDLTNFTDVFAAGYPKSNTYYFSGTFDGLGHTIQGVRVADGGIFGMMRGATVKNLNLTGVQYREDAPATVTNQESGYRALFAYAAPNSTFENIYVQVVYTTGTWDWKRDGVLVNTSSWGAATYRNITVDATGVKLRTLLGTNYSDSNVYENVVFKAPGYVAIGYTGDSYGTGGVQNVDAMLTEFPAGVSFEFANGMVAQNKDYLGAYELYQGDVTALGFAEGAHVIQSGVDTASGWDTAYATRAKVGYIDSSYDYVDIPFSVTKAGATFTVWDGVNASYGVTATAVTPSKTESARTIVILNANGDRVGSIAANTMYTMRMYMLAANGDGISNLQITSQNAGTIYFGDVTFGNDAVIEVNGLGLTSNTSYPIEITPVVIDGFNAYKVYNYKGASIARANLDVAELTGKSTLTFSFYVEEGSYSGNLFRFRVKPYSAQYVDFAAADYAAGQWHTVSVDLATLEADGTFTDFMLQLQTETALTIYVKDITVV